jgi:hypothetical protein
MSWLLTDPNEPWACPHCGKVFPEANRDGRSRPWSEAGVPGGRARHFQRCAAKASVMRFLRWGAA